MKALLVCIAYLVTCFYDTKCEKQALTRCYLTKRAVSNNPHRLPTATPRPLGH